ncbi:hypothetical protein ABV409_08065 [Flagellimonas sp. DF-77]|uniref:hypothetical protein n=1 Tax=Flagellimonas algarum TaxID=3230298 RepID=UPI0033981A26
MVKTIDRLLQYIQHAGLSARQFDISIGASNGYTLRMKKNHASIGSDVIETIVKTYPDLNLVWLITGEGPMLNQNKGILQSGALPEAQQKEIEAIVDKKLEAQHQQEVRELLAKVAAEIAQLKKQ